jgi:hypothetical protein
MEKVRVKRKWTTWRTAARERWMSGLRGYLKERERPIEGQCGLEDQPASECDGKDACFAVRSTAHTRRGGLSFHRSSSSQSFLNTCLKIGRAREI